MMSYDRQLENLLIMASTKSKLEYLLMAPTKSKSKSKSISKPKPKSKLRSKRKQEGKLMMVGDCFYIPKNKPSKPLGEDAHFFSKAAQVIGVADGVGGWASKGIDSGIFARDLMRYAELAVWGLRPADVDPKRVLREAFWRTEAEGSSTALILSLAGDVLLAANVGDSRFTVIRGGKTFHTSRVQHHYKFNCPYQLQKNKRGNGPEQTEVIEVEVVSGDIIIVGTDGLFDNLFPETIEEIVNDCRNWELLPEKLATAAYHMSKSKTAATPYEVGARKAGVKWSGGKRDDITVVVAHVVCESRHEHYY